MGFVTMSFPAFRRFSFKELSSWVGPSRVRMSTANTLKRGTLPTIIIGTTAPEP